MYINNFICARSLRIIFLGCFESRHGTAFHNYKVVRWMVTSIDRNSSDIAWQRFCCHWRRSTPNKMETDDSWTHSFSVSQAVEKDSVGFWVTRSPIRIHAVYLGVSEIAQKTTTVGRRLKRGHQHWMLRLRRPDDSGRKLPAEVAEKTGVA